MNRSLVSELVDSTPGQPLQPVFISSNTSRYAKVGFPGTLWYKSSAVLTVPILGSIRTIQDFTEGPCLLIPEIQGSFKFNKSNDGGVVMSRLWLSDLTSTEFAFVPVNCPDAANPTVGNKTLTFDAGGYCFYAYYDYP